MPECQQGTQRRSGVPQTSAGCQKLENTRGMKRDPLRQARRGPTHARTGWRAVDSCSPLWPLIFEAQYNLRATVFTFLCHLTKYKAAKRERKRGGCRCVCGLPPRPAPSPYSPPPPDVLPRFLLDSEIRLIYILRWKYTQCDPGKGTTWNRFYPSSSLLPLGS